jgi:hypothetical protein
MNLRLALPEKKLFNFSGLRAFFSALRSSKQPAKVAKSLHVGGRKIPRAVRQFKFTHYAENPNQRRVVVIGGGQ